MEGIDLVAQSAQTHVTWALSILGGSIAAILGTAYLSPAKRIFRLWYLLFLPGWICIAGSIYYGDRVVRRHIASEFVNDDNLPEIVRAMNTDYETQQALLFTAVVVFTIWLIGYLIWWIFRK